MAAPERDEPLRFVVVASDGTVVDRFFEDELSTWESEPTKTWQEAVLFGYIATRKYEERRDRK